MRIHSAGHDALYKILVEGRNGREILESIGVVDKISVSKAEESGAMWLAVGQCLSSLQPPPPCEDPLLICDMEKFSIGTVVPLP